MTLTTNISDNNALAALGRQAGPRVTSAIKVASNQTGVDFAYLMEQAKAESAFKADAQAKTSSASGLYQFIESTWMHMVKNYGAKYGMGDLAAKIDDHGKVADAATKQEILDLRKDPEKSALLAAEFAASNKRYLEQNYSGDIGSTELYFAHFMGAGGASAFLNEYKKNPLQNAADLFPKEARANRNVFYDRQTGQARTLAEVYDFFDKKFSDSPAATNDMGDVQTAQTINTPLRLNNAKSAAAYMDLFGTKDIAGAALDNPLNDRTVRAFITHPSLEFLAPEIAATGWKPRSTPLSSLVADPVELMILSHFAMPTSRQQERNS